MHNKERYTVNNAEMIDARKATIHRTIDAANKELLILDTIAASSVWQKLLADQRKYISPGFMSTYGCDAQINVLVADESAALTLVERLTLGFTGTGATLLTGGGTSSFLSAAWVQKHYGKGASRKLSPDQRVIDIGSNYSSYDPDMPDTDTGVSLKMHTYFFAKDDYSGPIVKMNILIESIPFGFYAHGEKIERDHKGRVVHRSWYVKHGSPIYTKHVQFSPIKTRPRIVFYNDSGEYELEG